MNNPNDPIAKAAYKRFRNKTSELIKKAEVMYYKKILNSHNNSSKALWKTFGKVLNNKKVKHNNISSLSVNGKTQTDPQEIANSFNNSFSEIGEKLASKFSNQNSSEFKKYLGAPVPHSIYLYSISEAEIIDVIMKLKKQQFYWS